MPGTKRKIDEDTWLVNSTKKFKQGILLSAVYETTLAHLRLGARNFFNSLIGSSSSSTTPMDLASPAGSEGAGPSSASPASSPPASPVRDIITENELQTMGVPLMPRPAIICQDCIFQTRNPLGNEDLYGKCAYCDKLVCHLNSCRSCGSNFCGQCCIAKFDYANETFQCYSCLD